MSGSDKNKFINIDLSRDESKNGNDEVIFTEFKPKTRRPSSFNTENQPASKPKQELKMELVSNVDQADVEGPQQNSDKKNTERKIKSQDNTAGRKKRNKNKSALKKDTAKSSKRTDLHSEKSVNSNKTEVNREKKDVSKIKRAAVFILALLFVSMAVFAAYWFIRADEIIVEGNDTISDEDIIRLSGISEGDHFFTIDKGACKEGIETATKLEFLGIDYELSGKLTIKVYERKEAAQLMVGENEYVIIDHDGNALDKSSVMTNYPLISGVGVTEYMLAYQIKADDSSKLEKINLLLSELESHYLIEEISEIDLTNISSVLLKCNGGIEVDFGQISSVSDVCRKVTWIQSVLPELYDNGYNSGVLNVTADEQATFEPTAGQDGSTAEVILSEVGEAVIAHG